jgi:hypothetical protein
MTQQPSLALSCLDGDECVVYFEPWGSEHALAKGDVMRIETTALNNGAVEISFVGNGISVCISSNDEIRVVNGAGRELRI